MPSDPYASHLPVLEKLAEALSPKRVLEFGAGRYSTPFFLSLGCELVSVETNPEWAGQVESGNPRHTVAQEAPSVEGFDLVLVDDGVNASDRERTIRAVLAQSYSVVAIHDAEVPQYATAIAELAASHIFYTEQTPYTAVAWRP